MKKEETRIFFSHRCFNLGREKPQSSQVAPQLSHFDPVECNAKHTHRHSKIELKLNDFIVPLYHYIL